jgi:TolB-like protein/DNA-binding winged helix-turn-helix (wHTH) protein/Tfp pilus assembly protein PilF
MEMNPKHFYQFGPFILDPAEHTLVRAGVPVALTPKAFDTLLTLVRRSPRIVEKEDLFKEVWPGTFVEDGNLAVNIFALRKALGTEEGGRDYIETIPKRGYRFTAEVNQTIGSAVDLNAARSSPSALDKKRSKNTLARTALLSLGILALAVIAAFIFRARPQPSGGRLMLAVLPFENLTGDAGQAYFSDGLTEEMITQLGGLQPGRLGVISRTSAMRFKRGEKSVGQIGRELGVQYVLEGSVRSEGNRVRISVQLTRVSDQSHVWTKSYEQDRRDALTVQSQVARDIADAVELQLTPDQQRRLASPRAVNPDAYEAYLKGRSMYMQHSPPDFERAIKYFQEAIEKDPNYPLAYSELADSFILLSSFGLTSQKETIPKARTAAQKALEIDPTLAEPHASLALIAQNYDWDWKEADYQYRRAIQLNPNYAPAHHWYASGYLTIMGRFDDAVAELGKARELDPLSAPIRTALAKVLLLAGRYERAIPELKNILEVRPNSSVAHNLLGWAYLETGRPDEAHLELTTAAHLVDTPGNLADIGVYYARIGRNTEAEKVLAQLRERRKSSYVSPVEFAEIYAALGKKNQAFEAFQEAYSERTIEMVSLKLDRQFASLHSDARYADLMRRIGLPP